MSEYFKKNNYYLKIKGTKVLGVSETGIELDELDEPMSTTELLASLQISTKEEFDAQYIKTANLVNELIKN